jgi:hypothetical protein
MQYSRQADLLTDPGKAGSIGKTVFLTDLIPRTLRSYEDATAGLLSLLAAPTMLKALLENYVVISTGDYHKHKLCSRLLALPQADLLGRLAAVDPTKFEASMQVVMAECGVDRAAAERRLHQATQNVMDVPGMSRCGERRCMWRCGESRC